MVVTYHHYFLVQNTFKSMRKLPVGKLRDYVGQLFHVAIHLSKVVVVLGKVEDVLGQHVFWIFD